MPTVLDIVPITRMPRGKDCFSYTADTVQTPRLGTIARIPFRSRTIDGIVWGIQQSTPTIKLKPITNLEHRPALSDGQRALLDRITQYYGGSRSTMIGPILAIQRRLQQLGTEQRSPSIISTQISVLSIHELIAWLIQSTKQHSRGQYYILAPSTTVVEAVYDALNKNSDRERIAMVTPSTTTVELRTIAERLQSPLPTIVVGTRRSLLLPWAALTHIVLIDDHNGTHRQWDMEPRIDNRIVAEWLAQYWGAQYSIIGPIISLQCYQRHPPIRTAWHWGTTLLERVPDSFRCWSAPATETQEWVAWIRVQRESQIPVVIISPDRFAGIIICKGCQRVQRCTHCQRALEVRSQQWWCAWCNTQQTSLGCRHCQGTNLKITSSHTTSIKRIVEQFFPEDDVRIEQQESFSSTGIVIIQASSLAAWLDDKRWQRSTTVSNTAVLIWDLLSSLSTGYSQEENALRTIATARDVARAHPLLALGLLNVPEHLSQIQSSDQYNQWYAQELKTRQSFRYPPSASIIVLDTHDQVRNNTNTITRIIQTLQTAVGADMEIIGPLPSWSRRKSYKQRIALILRATNTLPIEGLMPRILPHIPVGWSITPNPELLPSSLPI